MMVIVLIMMIVVKMIMLIMTRMMTIAYEQQKSFLQPVLLCGFLISIHYRSDTFNETPASSHWQKIFSINTIEY